MNNMLNYMEEGGGKPVVLLHGYLESADIWSEYATGLAGEYHVIRVDLPGHGASVIPAGRPSVDRMGDETMRLLDRLGLEKVALIGHSMGGYVCMSIAERYPGRLWGFVLFHSVPYADNEEKRRNRNRGIALIRSGRKAQLVNAHAPTVFSPANEKRMSDALEKVKAIAMSTADKGVTYALRAMKDRQDRARVLQETRLPVGLIFGMHDRFIPVEAARQVASLNRDAKLYWLTQSGHNGFLEEPDLSVSHTLEFLEWAGK